MPHWIANVYSAPACAGDGFLPSKSSSFQWKIWCSLCHASQDTNLHFPSSFLVCLLVNSAFQYLCQDRFKKRMTSNAKHQKPRFWEKKSLGNIWLQDTGGSRCSGLPGSRQKEYRVGRASWRPSEHRKSPGLVSGTQIGFFCDLKSLFFTEPSYDLLKRGGWTIGHIPKEILHEHFTLKLSSTSIFEHH